MGVQSVPRNRAAKLSLRIRVFPLIGLLLPLLAAAVDKGMATSIMPRAAAELNGFSIYSWTATAHLLMSTIAMLVFAKLSDLYGRKRLYFVSALILVCGSLSCAGAGSINQLILARGLVGIGDGAIIALAFTFVADLCAPSERARYQGLLSAAYGIGAVAGLTMGGWIADHFPWRSAFWIDVPVGVIAILSLNLALPDSQRDHRRHSIDWVGIVALCGWLVPLLLALTGAGAGIWSTATVRELLIGSGVVLLIFFFVERRAPEPILSLGLFRVPRIALSCLNLFLQGICVFTVIVFLPVCLQGGRGASAAQSALVITSVTVAIFVGNIAGGQLVSRTGKYGPIATVGAGLGAAGLFLLSRVDVATTPFGLFGEAVICGLAFGCLTPTYEVLVQNATDQRQMGAATGSTRFLYSMGGTIGPVLLGSVLSKTYHGHLDPGIPVGTPAALRQLLDDPLKLFLTRPNLDSTISQIQGGKQLLSSALNNAQNSLLSAVHTVFLIGALIMAGSCLLNLLVVDQSSDVELKRRRLRLVPCWRKGS